MKGVGKTSYSTNENESAIHGWESREFGWDARIHKSKVMQY